MKTDFDLRVICFRIHPCSTTCSFTVWILPK